MSDNLFFAIKSFFMGISYILSAYLIFLLEHQLNLFKYDGLMTISFLFLIPFASGVLSAYIHSSVTKLSSIVYFATPPFSILGAIITTVLIEQEGVICALMAAPIFIVLSILGSLFGLLLFKRKKNNKLYISLVLLAPFVIGPVEDQLSLSSKIFSEHTTIIIHSNKETVWKNITRVDSISEQENQSTLFQFMGFPRPIEAVLDTVAVGGIRKAIFARGLLFTETVTELETNKILAFTIETDPKSIPPTALDEHVMVGGAYFDVLDGKYEIESIDSHTIKLHLTSQFRLSTKFNFYSGFWSKLIMRDIQENILNIVKRRCESNRK